jgi:ribonuclease D
VADLEGLARRLADLDEIALDTEGDSLHHYPERLALIQIGDRAGEAWLVDPLAMTDLGVLGKLVARSRPQVVLHAGDNDLAHLKRRYGFTFGAIFDTSLAARFLGARALGLDVLLREYLGIELPPSRQKDDWSVRPLTPAQERYAAADVLHLLALKDHLVEALRSAGRLHWVEEECAALAAEAMPERPVDPDAFFRLKGARDLKPRQLGILKALWTLRERLARSADRPPFKILGDTTLVALAVAAPRTVADLGQVSSCTPRVVGRWGQQIIETIARAQALADDELPVPPRPPRLPSVPGAVRRRIELLRQWRTDAAPATGLEAGVVLPNRLMRPVAEAAPRDVEALARVEGIRRWRVEAFGPQILAVVRGS